jgi:shikimate dehydrogenase
MTQPRAFVIGHPIGHSRSPMLHGYWLKRYAIDGSYEKLDVPPEQLGDFFARFRKEKYIGANVTIPHKMAVMSHVDRIDDVARAMGAVNALWWDSGSLVGGNTDALGFIGNLDVTVQGWDSDAGFTVVLGAGGAARAAAFGLKTRGFAVALCNRTVEKAQKLADELGEGVTAHGPDELAKLLPEADLLVNATSLGMVGQPPTSVDLSPMKPSAIVYDAVYVPLDTGLLKAARQRGLRTVDGLGMLLHQGVAGFQKWFDIRPDVTPDLRKLLEDHIRASTPGA